VTASPSIQCKPPATILGSMLYGYWEASSGVYSDAGSTLATNGQTVQQWNDQSGNGRHWSQATGGNRPTLKTGIVNRLPVIRFDGSSSFMKLAAAFSPAGAYTIIFVMATSSTADQICLSLTGANRQGYRLNESATGCLSAYDGTNGHRSAASLVPTNSTFFIGTTRVTTEAGCRLSKNGEEGLYAVAPTPIANTMSLDVLGRFENGLSNYMSADIAAILFVNGEMTQRQWVAVEAYLAQRYAISLAAARAPVDVSNLTFTEPDGAYFTSADAFCQERGVIAIGDWAVTPVEAIALAQSVSIPVATSIYVRETLGFGNFAGYMMLDLEGASSLYTAYPDIITQLKIDIPSAKIGVWLGSPVFIANAPVQAQIAVSDTVYMENYQEAVETDAQAKADSYRIMRETKAALAAAGLGSTPIIPVLATEVGRSHPDYVEGAPPLTTSGNMIARRQAILDAQPRAEAVSYWGSCLSSNPTRAAAINVLVEAIRGEVNEAKHTEQYAATHRGVLACKNFFRNRIKRTPQLLRGSI
jgi:hypothetical protein